MSTNTRTIKEFKQQISVYELISWHEATLLSNRRSLPYIRPPSPLNSVLRCYDTVCGVAYLRKRLQEGKVLCAYISESPLQSYTLKSLDARGSAGVSHNGEVSKFISVISDSSLFNDDHPEILNSDSQHDLCTVKCTNCKQALHVKMNRVANYKKGQKILCSRCEVNSHVCERCRGIYSSMNRDPTNDYDINMCQSCQGIQSEPHTLSLNCHGRSTCCIRNSCKCNLM